MRKLLRANFARLFRNPFFWCSLVCMAVFAALHCFSGYQMKINYDAASPLDGIFSSYHLLLVILMAVFISLFIGTEYSDGTMRNKVTTGAGRGTIYLSFLITTAVAGLLMTLAYLVALCAVGIPLLGFLQTPGTTLISFAVGVVLTVAFAALYTLASMLITNKTAVAILTLLCVIGGLLLANDMLELLNQPEFHSGITVTENNVIEEINTPNPYYLDGPERARMLFLLDLLPTGQSLRLAQEGAATPLRMLLCSVTVALIATTAGLYFFRRKDLK